MFCFGVLRYGSNILGDLRLLLFMPHHLRWAFRSPRVGLLFEYSFAILVYVNGVMQPRKGYLYEWQALSGKFMCLRARRSRSILCRIVPTPLYSTPTPSPRPPPLHPFTFVSGCYSPLPP